MPAPAATTVVITDANVLINFVHIGQVTLLGDLPAYRFQLPAEVLHELIDDDQRAQIEAAIATHQLDLMVIEALDTLMLFGELRDLMGRGEAACLAVAATRGYHLASDEKKALSTQSRRADWRSSDCPNRRSAGRGHSLRQAHGSPSRRIQAYSRCEPLRNAVFQLRRSTVKKPSRFRIWL